MRGQRGFQGRRRGRRHGDDAPGIEALRQETRQADAEYIPVGSSVTRNVQRKVLEDFKKIESQLEAKRNANEAAGNTARQLGATPAPEPAKVP